MGLLHDIRRRLIEALGGSLLGDIGAVTSDEEELRGFRPITARVKTRDLNVLSHAEMVKLSFYLYSSNNLAKWLVNTPVALAVGKEVPYSVDIDLEMTSGQKRAPTSPDEARRLATEIRGWLDMFWEHATHDICGRGDLYAKTFLVTGHLVLPVTAVNPVSGVPQLDLIDAGQIRGTTPLNGSSIMPGTVLYAPFGTYDIEPRALQVIRPNVDGAILPLEPDAYGLRGGLYFANSSVLNSLRGISYLMDVADWLDALDQGTWTSLDRAKLRNAIVWHLQMTGADTPEKINAEVNKVVAALANPGNVYGSNERITLEAKAANIEAADTVDLHRLIRTHILGSKSMPESWYSEGGNANRATAGEQTDVAYKALGELQQAFRRIFRTLLQFGYDSIQAKQTRLPFRPECPWLKLEPILPTVQERDTSRQVVAVERLEASLDAAMLSELISKQTARATFLALIGKVAGVPIELDTEVGRIEAEAKTREVDQAAQANARARTAFARAGAAPPGADGLDGDGAASGGGAAAA